MKNRKRTITFGITAALTVGLLAGGAVTFANQFAGGSAAAPSKIPGRSALVYPGAGGKLVYKPWNDKGDTVLDFSNCGYGGGGVALPVVPVKVTLSPVAGEGDDTERLQSAIERVSALRPGGNGFRGTVLLKRGRYRIGAPLKITTSGIVLRGEGSGENGTLLYATGRTPYSLIEVGGATKLVEVTGTSRRVIDRYVPVGARSFTLENAAGFKAGDQVLVRRVGNADWIHFIGMDRIVPRASSLRVFAEAPGGWRQGGEDQPIGWVHESMLER